MLGSAAMQTENTNAHCIDIYGPEGNKFLPYYCYIIKPIILRHTRLYKSHITVISKQDCCAPSHTRTERTLRIRSL